MTCTIVTIWINSKKKINILFGLQLPCRGNILKEAKSDMDFQIDIKCNNVFYERYSVLASAAIGSCCWAA